MKASKIKSRLQHNPASSIPEVFKRLQGFSPTDKCKLYILMAPTPNNPTPLEVHRGVKLKNINRVLSKRTKRNQLTAFLTIRQQYGKPLENSRTFKIFSN